MMMESELDSLCVSRCENCCLQLENEKRRTSFEITDDGGISTEEVQIFDALVYIYGISWDEFFSLSTYHSINGLEEIKKIPEIPTNLCESCIQLVSENYAAHKRFENASHSSSVIHQINKFRLEKWKSIENKETFDSYSASALDNDYPNDDDLVESFNFEDKEKLNGDEVEIEDKFIYAEDISENFKLNPVSISEEEGSSCKSQSNPEPRITTRSLRSQVVVKLETLPWKDVERHLVPKKKSSSITKIEGSELQVEKRKKANNLITSPEEDISKKRCDQVVENNLKNRKYRCKVCGQKFISLVYLRRKHLPKHYGKGFRKNCEVCGKLLKSGKGYREHIAVAHVGDEEREKLRIPCEICGAKVFPSSLSIHMRKQHSQQREFHKCETCGKEYLSKASYEDHMLTHSENFTPYLCGHCGKSFVSKLVLNSHEKFHSEEKKYSCTLCSQTFLQSCLLKYHMQITHSTEPRKFVCHKCGKSYARKGQLSRHLQIHKEIEEKGENNIKCDKCGIVFRHSFSFKKHNKEFHTDGVKKKVYECSFCGKVLSSPQVLTSHENLHKNNPQYQPRKKHTWKRTLKSETVANT